MHALFEKKTGCFAESSRAKTGTVGERDFNGRTQAEQRPASDGVETSLLEMEKNVWKTSKNRETKLFTRDEHFSSPSEGITIIYSYMLVCVMNALLLSWKRFETDGAVSRAGTCGLGRREGFRLKLTV